MDLVTVTEELRQREALEKVGGITYLTELANTVPTAAHVEYYARIIEEKALLRNLIHAATEIVSMGYDGQEEVEKILDEAEKKIFAIANRRAGRTIVSLKNILIEAFEQIEKLYESHGAVTGVPTGFSDLDRFTAGLQPSDLIILAARPSMGKTTFALNIAENAAVHLQIPVIVFSLEMSKEQLAMKLLCAEAVWTTNGSVPEIWRKRIGPVSPTLWADSVRLRCLLMIPPIFPLWKSGRRPVGFRLSMAWD